MAASIAVEEQHGAYTWSPSHPHNGYYAGDFSRYPVGRPVPTPVVCAPAHS